MQLSLCQRANLFEISCYSSISSAHLIVPTLALETPAESLVLEWPSRLLNPFSGFLNQFKMMVTFLVALLLMGSRSHYWHCPTAPHVREGLLYCGFWVYYETERNCAVIYSSSWKSV